MLWIRRGLILILLCLPIGGPSVWSAPLPWAPVRPGDLTLISNPRVEQAVRLDLIRQAKRTIDLVIFDQRLDAQVAMPVLQALRQAADRGVKVRFLTAWFPQLASDLLQTAPRYLTDPPARVPVEYLIFSGQHLRHPWAISDSVHEKLLIIDHDTVMTTGRGHAALYLDWLDTAYLLRGALARQSIQVFEDLWWTVRREAKPYSPPPGILSRYRAEVPPIAIEPLKLSPEETLEATQVLSRHEDWGPGARARAIHHDFVKQLAQLSPAPARVDYDRRLAILKDSVVEAVLAKLPGAREVRINLLSAVLHPKLRDGLIQALKHGTRVQIFTNSDEAMRTIVPIAAPWILSLPDLAKLLQAGAEVQLFKLKPSSPWTYLHWKLAIVDDTVFTGSHNFNSPSTLANDELSFEIESKLLAAKLRAMHDQSIAENGAPLKLEQVQTELASTQTQVSQKLFQSLLGFF